MIPLRFLTDAHQFSLFPLGDSGETIKIEMKPAFFIALLLIISSWCFMCVSTWDCWIEPFVDFGREVYVPSMLSTGQHLYTDISYFNGPVSPWWNAGWFVLFGSSLRTITSINLLLSLMFTILLFLRLTRYFGVLSAFFSCIVFIFLFIFPQLTQNNAFNYVAPYSHEMTHGLYLSFMAIFLLLSSNKNLPAKVSTTFFAGFLTGLVFMLKPELFIALIAAIITHAIIKTVRSAKPHQISFKTILFFSTGMFLPLIASTIYICTYLPLSHAMLSVAGAWQFIFSSSVSNTTFYRFISGANNLQVNLFKMIKYSIESGLFTILLIFGSFQFSRFKSNTSRYSGMIVFSLLLSFLFTYYFNTIPWHDIPKALPVLLISILAFLLLQLKKCAGHSRTSDSLSAIIPLFVFSLVLLLKIFFFVRFYHYGFVLAAPAALVVICFVLSIVPQLLRTRKAWAPIFQSGFLIFMLFIVVGHLKPAYAHNLKKLDLYESDQNRFWGDQRVKHLQSIINAVNTNLKDDETLSVLPQGAIVNFLSHHPTSVPHLIFMPTELAMFGESKIVDDFKSSPPDFIILRDRSTAEHGVEFGVSYGLELLDWITKNYTLHTQITRKSGHGLFGVQLLKHNKTASDTAPGNQRYAD